MFLASLAITALLGGTFVPLAAGAPVKLTYSTFFPPTHVQSKLAEAWCKEVEKKAGGQIKVEYYPGGTLTKASQIYDGVIQGLSDIGFCLFAYTPGRFPLMEAVDLPMGYPDGVAATKVINAVYEKFKPKELKDVEVLYLHAHGPGILHTRGKAVDKLADLAGLKIRTTGFSAKTVKALGGTPVAMPMPEAYPALQKGVVDGSMHPQEADKGWKLGDVLKYATLNLSTAYTTGFYVVMNKNKWAALPDGVKKTILAINKEWIPKHGQAWVESDEEGQKYFQSKGGKLIKQAAAESKLWQQKVRPLLDEFAKEAEKKGVPGKQVVDFTLQILAK